MAIRKVEFEDGVKPEDAARDFPDEHIHEVQRHIKKDEKGKTINDDSGNPVYVNILLLGDSPKEEITVPKTLEQEIVELKAMVIQLKNEDARMDSRIKTLEGA